MRASGHQSSMTDQPLDDREDSEPELPADDEDEPEDDE
jgi:hypothetical protein